MALETLKGVKQIRDAHILADRPRKEDGTVDWELFDEQRKSHPIYVDHDVNMISFRIQNGPIKEVGVNGCQVVDVIATAKMIIEKLNEKFPSQYNEKTIDSLDSALYWQDKRTKDREARNVEGTSNK